MSSLGSRLSELEGIQKTKASLESWIHSQENTVAEMLQRPAKLRTDAAQLEINLVTDMRQSVAEKQSALDEIEARESNVGAAAAAAAAGGGGGAGDHHLKIALDTLDEHVRISRTSVSRPFSLTICGKISVNMRKR